MSYIYSYIFENKTLITLGDIPDIEPIDDNLENIYNVLTHYSNEINNYQSAIEITKTNTRIKTRGLYHSGADHTLRCRKS